MEADDREVKAQYLDYLRQYRACLAEEDVDRLEDEWRVLDEKWMQIRCAGAGPGQRCRTWRSLRPCSCWHWAAAASVAGGAWTGMQPLASAGAHARRYWIQVVHDIEYGYAATSRC